MGRTRRLDNRHNDTQNNNIQQYDTQHIGFICDT
jgi:hypothetical protein